MAEYAGPEASRETEKYLQIALARLDDAYSAAVHLPREDDDGPLGPEVERFIKKAVSFAEEALSIIVPPQ